MMPEASRILIVDDDPIVADSLAEFLSREGYATATACDGMEALNMLHAAKSSTSGGTAAEGFALVITDINMPRNNGMQLIKDIRGSYPSVAAIVVTGFGKIESAVESIRLGAVDYLTKPVVDDELRVAVNKAIQQHALLAENQSLKNQLAERFGMGNIIGADYRMQKVYDLVEAVAESKTTVLIEGESGTGKSMIAHAVHAKSPRHAGPFVTFSCGAIPETLLESELFGHVRGAFTGADKDKPGKCLAANGGTLFIDEINSATPMLQLKLLRVLQEKKFEPIGSNETVSVDVRFVLATNQPLPQLVEAGAFREDLYYRINVVSIHLPSLSQRIADIPLLVEAFLAKYSKETGKDRSITEDALVALGRYHWPGNVRELENVIERAVVLSRQPIIGVDDLPDGVRDSIKGVSPGLGSGLGSASSGGPTANGHNATLPALQNGWTPMPLSKAMEDPERQVIRAALDANAWNRQATARELDINRTTLYKKIKHYKLDEPG